MKSLPYPLFPVRVYGICTYKNQVLILEEIIRGETIFKFPGGGVEYGESPEQCLKRELKEELNMKDVQTELFFIPPQPIINYFRPDTQVLPIYYRVFFGKDEPVPHAAEEQIHALHWLEINDKARQLLTFDSDRLALGGYFEPPP